VDGRTLWCFRAAGFSGWIDAETKERRRTRVAPNGDCATHLVRMPPGHGDGRRLTQVLINLVGNAIKSTDVGEVAIKAEANNGLFQVSVRDTGPGISAADQAKLFQEFQSSSQSMGNRTIVAAEAGCKLRVRSRHRASHTPRPAPPRSR
jgi:signal transduction histidine kinase